MSSSASKSGTLGGLGALFFLASLGAIAYYVQQQSIPAEREALRAPATVLDENVEEAPVLALPWEDRLDLANAQMMPFGALPAATPGTAPVPAAGSEGRLVQTLEDGHRVLYTLDPVLQDSALTIFRNREVPYGAAVVIDLRDNSLLAFAGHSSADAQVDPLEVLTTPWSPAASVFKLVTAAALLERGVPSSQKACFHGGLQGITDDLLVDDPAQDTRCESLSSAVAHSHNVVIAKLAMANLDEAALRQTAQNLLWEQKIPFEFAAESSPALIPADPRERAKVAAGFWQVDMSPLHGAVLASIFAREGMYQPPHIIAQVVGPDGSDLTPLPIAPKRVLGAPAAKQVGKMMVGTTTEGTAKKSFFEDNGTPFIPGVAVAGKTGSLTGKRAPAYNYNWFVGFAPADDPQIAFAVLIANEADWKIKAHYAGRRLVQVWLERRKAIDAQRHAKIQGESLVLPARDENSGAVISKGPSLPPIAAGSSDALPPVPGAVATPAAAAPPADAKAVDSAPAPAAELPSVGEPG